MIVKHKINCLQSGNNIKQKIKEFKKSYLLNRIQMLRFPEYQDQNKQQENGLEEGILDIYQLLNIINQFTISQRNNYMWNLESMDQQALQNYIDILQLENRIMLLYIFHLKKRHVKLKKAMNYKQLLRERLCIIYMQEYEKDTNMNGFNMKGKNKQMHY